jgi:peptide/nickel transport system substrate-binding protein
VTYYTPGYVVTRATQRTLMAYPPGDAERPVPDLAAAPPRVSADGRTVTVRIRDGVRFSPPVDREVSARDVKYGIERGFFRTVANGYVGSYFADLVGARPGAAPGRTIAGVQTPDPHTVVFRLARGTGRLLAGALTMPLAAPVPREYALRFDRREPSAYGMHQVATGPYMVTADARGRVTGYRAGRSISLVRNPRWDRRPTRSPPTSTGSRSARATRPKGWRPAASCAATAWSAATSALRRQSSSAHCGETATSSRCPSPTARGTSRSTPRSRPWTT